MVTAAGKSTPVLSAHAYINWIGLKSGSDVKIRCSVRAQARLLLSLTLLDWDREILPVPRFRVNCSFK